jgi:hypothetical protein
MNKIIQNLVFLIGILGVLVFQNAQAQGSITVSPIGNRDVRTAAYTVAGFFAPAAPVINGVLDDIAWTTAYDATGTNITGGAGFNGTSFPSSQEIKEQINVDDSGTDAPAVPAPLAYSGFPSTAASFGIVWDEEFMYIAARIADGAIVPTTAEATINGNQVITSAGIEFFFNNGVARSAANPLSANWPRNYNSSRDMQLVFNHLPTGTDAIFPEFGTPGIENIGIPLSSTDDYKFAIKKTGTGYVFEGRIRWTKLLTELVDAASGVYIADANGLFRIPNKTIPGLGFDMSVNLTKGSPRGQMMWNQCCYNANWTQSQFFGYLDLAGDIIDAPCPSTITITTTSNAITTPLQAVTAGAVISPANADRSLKWEVSGLSGSYPLALISDAQVISPLNNGNLTITATSLCTVGGVQSSTLVLPISGQVQATSINISGANISSNWANSTMSATADPTGAPNNVTWSISSGATLATINSVTGVLRSTSLGNGQVTVQATSIQNGITGTKNIDITNQIVLSCVGLNSYTKAIQCNRTLRTITFLGFALNDKVQPLMQYFDPNSTIAGVVPADLVEFNFLANSGIPVKLERSGSNWEMTFLQTSGTFTITGVYKNDPNIKFNTITRLRASTNESVPGCALTVPGYFTVEKECNTTGIAKEVTIESSMVSISPNPANSSVIISANIPASGVLNISVVNLLGVEVSSSSAVASSGLVSRELNTNSLPAGIYIVKVGLSGGGVVSKKLIIEK